MSCWDLGSSTGCLREHPSLFHHPPHSPQQAGTGQGDRRAARSSGQCITARIFFCWHHSDSPTSLYLQGMWEHASCSVLVWCPVTQALILSQACRHHADVCMWENIAKEGSIKTVTRKAFAGLGCGSCLGGKEDYTDSHCSCLQVHLAGTSEVSSMSVKQ